VEIEARLPIPYLRLSSFICVQSSFPSILRSLATTVTEPYIYFQAFLKGFKPSGSMQPPKRLLVSD
jgi:hypothetical protein